MGWRRVRRENHRGPEADDSSQSHVYPMKNRHGRTEGMSSNVDLVAVIRVSRHADPFLEGNNDVNFFVNNYGRRLYTV